jgi:S1-C subfamily serine protease
VVVDVVDGGPADRAGLRAGDIIVKVNGDATPNMMRVTRAIRMSKPGDDCDVEVVRGGDAMTVSAKLEDAPAEPVAAGRASPRVVVPERFRGQP